LLVSKAKSCRSIPNAVKQDDPEQECTDVGGDKRLALGRRFTLICFGVNGFLKTLTGVDVRGFLRPNDPPAAISSSV
jgi:hypothetical protein